MHDSISKWLWKCDNQFSCRLCVGITKTAGKWIKTRSIFLHESTTWVEWMEERGPGPWDEFTFVKRVWEYNAYAQKSKIRRKRHEEFLPATAFHSVLSFAHSAASPLSLRVRNVHDHSLWETYTHTRSVFVDCQRVLYTSFPSRTSAAAAAASRENSWGKNFDDRLDTTSSTCFMNLSHSLTRDASQSINCWRLPCYCYLYFAETAVKHITPVHFSVVKEMNK